MYLKYYNDNFGKSIGLILSKEKDSNSHYLIKYVNPDNSINLSTYKTYLPSVNELQK